MKLINNVEDIYRPKLKDWFYSSEVRPMQQLILYTNMQFINLFSNGFIVPTQKFLRYLPSKKKLLVTGCCEVKDEPKRNDKTIKMLFSGKIEKEFGIELLIKSIEQMKQNNTSLNFSLDICGAGNQSAWLKGKIEKLGLSSIKYHGFVSDIIYKKLLKETDICLSLQNPKGRHNGYKTPSKFYEYLAYGKCVITSDAGDYSLLPINSFFMCVPYTSEKLIVIISDLIKNKEKIEETKMIAYLYAKKKFNYKYVGNSIKTCFFCD